MNWRNAKINHCEQQPYTTTSIQKHTLCKPVYNIFSLQVFFVHEFWKSSLLPLLSQILNNNNYISPEYDEEINTEQASEENATLNIVLSMCATNKQSNSDC